MTVQAEIREYEQRQHAKRAMLDDPKVDACTKEKIRYDLGLPMSERWKREYEGSFEPTKRCPYLFAGNHICVLPEGHEKLGLDHDCGSP